MLQESFLRVAEPNDLRDFRDVSTNWEAPACGIGILSFVQSLVDALRSGTYSGIAMLLSRTASQGTLDGHGLTQVDSRGKRETEESWIEVPVGADLLFAPRRHHGRIHVDRHVWRIVITSAPLRLAWAIWTTRHSGKCRAEDAGYVIVLDLQNEVRTRLQRQGAELGQRALPTRKDIALHIGIPLCDQCLRTRAVKILG